MVAETAFMKGVCPTLPSSGTASSTGLVSLTIFSCQTPLVPIDRQPVRRRLPSRRLAREIPADQPIDGAGRRQEDQRQNNELVCSCSFLSCAEVPS
jgi:hypothetical protein